MTLDAIPNLAFRQLVASLGAEIEPSSERTFELCLEEDDLPLRVTLHPDQRRVILQAYAADLSMVLGPLRAALMPVLLLVNQAGLAGRPFFVGLDARDFVCVTRIQPVEQAMGDEFLADLDYVARQALEVRQLVQSLTLNGADMEYEAVLAPGVELALDEEDNAAAADAGAATAAAQGGAAASTSASAG